MMKLYKRVCPLCGVEVFHTTPYSAKAAEANRTKCKACADKVKVGKSRKGTWTEGMTRGKDRTPETLEQIRDRLNKKLDGIIERQERERTLLANSENSKIPKKVMK